jgi:hypothetical protein
MDRVRTTAILSERQKVGAGKPSGLSVTTDAAFDLFDLIQILSMVTDSL